MSRPALVLSRLLAVAALVLAAVGIPLALGWSSASAYPSTTLSLSGHGYGHGRGMGQWGAFGYATKSGLMWDWHQILDHYYGGTHLDSQPDAEIGVRLTAEDGTDLTVTSGSPFTMGGVAEPAGTTVRFSMNGQGQVFAAVAPTGGCTGAQTFYGQVSDPSLVPSITSSDDLGTMLTICQPNGSRTYRGSLRMVNDSGVARTVNIVRMEQYLIGVIPRESPASWGDVAGGMNALEAQAVAARSYAWAESRYSYAKTCDSDACQVYGGAGQNGQKIESANSTTARNQTWQAVRRMDSNNAIARTEFSSSTGGYTAGGTFPAVVDDGDDVSGNSNHNRTTDIPVSTIESSYQLGTLQSVQVTQRNNLGADGGRVLNVTFTGSSKTLQRTGDQVRVDFGLRSNWFSVLPPSTTTTAPGSPPTTTLTPPSSSLHTWIIPAALPPANSALTAFGFGAPGDTVLSCDWNGDGVDTPGVFHNGMWTISNTESFAPSGLYTFAFGAPGDTPICGDWNGDGVDTVGIWRKGLFQLRNFNSPGPVGGSFRFGDATDQPIVGDWTGHHIDTLGVHRGDRFILSNNLSANMAVDGQYLFGNPGDGVVIGNWDGTGPEVPALHRGDQFFVGDGKGGVKQAFTFGVPGDQAVAGRFATGGPEVIGLVRG
jgi:SpoIID/LytB domain protein